jgi:hypothetical protein
MNVDRMREFYERAGYRVATTPGADWYVPGGRVYKNFPCGKTVFPAPGEIAGLCRHPGIIGVEFYNGRGVGVESGMWMVRDPSYGLHSLQRQFRQQLLQAAAREQVREIGFDELFRLGPRANAETLARLGFDDPHVSDPRNWRRLCRAGAETPGAGAFASFGPDGLTAYLVHFIVGETCYGLLSKSLLAARRSGANHALYYAFAHTMIRRPGIRAVSIGTQSVPPVEGVDRMKRHAGYRFEPFAVAAFLRPAAKALVTSAAGGLAVRAGARVFGDRGPIRRARALRDLIHATDEGMRAWDSQQRVRAIEH